ncbi:hypothetical protein [Xanthobacter agilis]|jgi:hypothetical protein|uniref:hypothetical protein n=1 Tax=Xanthobacter agilis TaxID=47492 RepID=UPI00372B5A50
MSAVTYPAKSFSLSRDASAAEMPAKGLFRRLFDALIAARAAQAEREVSRYLARRVEDHPDLRR